MSQLLHQQVMQTEGHLPCHNEGDGLVAVASPTIQSDQCLGEYFKRGGAFLKRQLEDGEGAADLYGAWLDAGEWSFDAGDLKHTSGWDHRVRKAGGSTPSVDEYLVGEGDKKGYGEARFFVRVSAGRGELSQGEVKLHQQLQQRGAGVLAPSSVTDLSGFTSIQPKLGWVSIWSCTETVGDRLRTLAEKDCDIKHEQGCLLINQWSMQEMALHRRGIVDTDPSIMGLYRQLLPLSVECQIAVSSPSTQLLMGQQALEYYKDHYFSDAEGSNIYIKNADRVPEKFRKYYRTRVRSMGLLPRSSDDDTALLAFFEQTFEMDLSPEMRSPKDVLDNLDLDACGWYVDRTRWIEMEVRPRELRCAPLMHPMMSIGMIDMMHYHFTVWFVKKMRPAFDLVSSRVTAVVKPALVWLTLFCAAYPDTYGQVYQLIKITRDKLLEDPTLLETKLSNRKLLHDVVIPAHQLTAQKRMLNPQAVGEQQGPILRAVRHCLAEIRSLNNPEEYTKLNEVLQRPHFAMMLPVDRCELQRLKMID